ncbi:MAG: WD40 repeat domain-containing protein, partial [Candidatus Firestonebacteria bacterium]|nr:WD40 repeat domain-containing protein [Candidatus Firestonebacteria bacterium]
AQLSRVTLYTHNGAGEFIYHPETKTFVGAVKEFAPEELEMIVRVAGELGIGCKSLGSKIDLAISRDFERQAASLLQALERQGMHFALMIDRRSGEVALTAATKADAVKKSGANLFLGDSFEARGNDAPVLEVAACRSLDMTSYSETGQLLNALAIERQRLRQAEGNLNLNKARAMIRQATGLKKPEDLKKILAPGNYRNLFGLSERLWSIEKAIRDMESRPGIPGFRMSEASRRAIFKTFLISADQPLDHITPRPLLDLKIDENKAEAFVQAHTPRLRSWSQFLIKELKQSYIDQEAFEDALRASIDAFKATLAQEPNQKFSVMLYRRGRSNDWVYHLAREMGLPKPEAIIYAAENGILAPEHLLILDDAAYTGRQIEIDVLGRVQSPHDHKLRTIHLVIPFLSPEAWNVITSKKPAEGFRLRNYVPQGLRKLNHTPPVQLYGTYLSYFQHKLPDDVTSVSYPQISEADSIRTVLVDGAIPSQSTMAPFLEGSAGSPYDSDYFNQVRRHLLAHWNTGQNPLSVAKSLPPQRLTALLKEMLEIYSQSNDTGRRNWLQGQIKELARQKILDPDQQLAINRESHLIFSHTFKTGLNDEPDFTLLPDGQTMALSTTWEDKIEFLDLKTRQLKFTLPRRASRLKVSGDGKTIFLSYDDSSWVWDLERKSELSQLKITKTVNDYLLSWDGHYLLNDDYGDLKIQNLQDPQEIRSWPIKHLKTFHPLRGNRMVIQYDDFDEDGFRLPNDSPVKFAIFDYLKGEVINTFTRPKEELHERLTTSVEGDRIVLYTSKEIKVIDPENPDKPVTYPAPDIPFKSLYYSLALRSFTFGMKNGEVQTWQVQNLLENEGAAASAGSDGVKKLDEPPLRPAAPVENVELLLTDVASKLFQRRDKATSTGADISGIEQPVRTVDQWQTYLRNILSYSGHEEQVSFLKAVNCYLDDNLPPAAWLQKINPPLLDCFYILCLRYQLLTQEAIHELAEEVLKPKISFLLNASGKLPVIIEVAAGYGDLSYGLKQALPDTTIYTTDASDSLYDTSVWKKRQITKLSSKEIADGSYRQKLHLTKDVPVIVIGAYLPHDRGVESDLLQATDVDAMYFMDTAKRSGDEHAVPNPKLWTENRKPLNSGAWFGMASAYPDEGILMMHNAELFSYNRVNSFEGILKKTNGAFKFWENLGVSPVWAGRIEGAMGAAGYLALYFFNSFFTQAGASWGILGAGFHLLGPGAVVVAAFYLGHLILGVYGQVPENFQERLANAGAATRRASWATLVFPTLLVLAVSLNWLAPAGIGLAALAGIILASGWLHGKTNAGKRAPEFVLPQNEIFPLTAAAAETWLQATAVALSRNQSAVTEFETSAQPKTPAAWKTRLEILLQGAGLEEKAAFLRSLQTYLKGELPPSPWLRKLSPERLGHLSALTLRNQLWTTEATREFARQVLTPEISRLHEHTGRTPVLVEVAAGNGDMSLGLRRALPNVRVIATDAFSAGYDETILKQHGVRKLSVREVADDRFRRLLGIDSKTPVIIVGANLPWNVGTENALLTAKSVDAIFELHSYHPADSRKRTGDETVAIDSAQWEQMRLLLDPNIYFGMSSRYPLDGPWQRHRTELFSFMRKNTPDNLGGAKTGPVNAGHGFRQVPNPPKFKFIPFKLDLRPGAACITTLENPLFKNESLRILLNQTMQKYFELDNYRMLAPSLGERSTAQEFRVAYDPQLGTFSFLMRLLTGKYLDLNTPTVYLPVALLKAYARAENRSARQVWIGRLIESVILFSGRQRFQPNVWDRVAFATMAFLGQPEALWKTKIAGHQAVADFRREGALVLGKVIGSQNETSPNHLLTASYSTLLSPWAGQKERLPADIEEINARLRLLQDFKFSGFKKIILNDLSGMPLVLPLPDNQVLQKTVIKQLIRFGIEMPDQPGRRPFRRFTNYRQSA